MCHRNVSYSYNTKKRSVLNWKVKDDLVWSILFLGRPSGAACVLEQECLTKSENCPAEIELEHMILKLMRPNHHQILRFLSAVDKRQTHHRFLHFHHGIRTVEPPLHLPYPPRQTNLYHRHVRPRQVLSGGASIETMFKRRHWWNLRYSHCLYNSNHK